jgi:hypothetical protein
MAETMFIVPPSEPDPVLIGADEAQQDFLRDRIVTAGCVCEACLGVMGRALTRMELAWARGDVRALPNDGFLLLPDRRARLALPQPWRPKDLKPPFPDTVFTFPSTHIAPSAGTPRFVALLVSVSPGGTRTVFALQAGRLHTLLGGRLFIPVILVTFPPPPRSDKGAVIGPGSMSKEETRQLAVFIGAAACAAAEAVA